MLFDEFSWVKSSHFNTIHIDPVQETELQTTWFDISIGCASYIATILTMDIS